MSTPNYSPDGLTYDDITALERDITAELRREGHLPCPRRRRSLAADARPRDAARSRTAPSPRHPAARRGQGRGEHS